MTTAPDYAVGPVHADSPEQVYQLAIDATKAIQDLRGIDANLKNDIAVTATELLHNAADHSRPEQGRPWSVHMQLIRDAPTGRYLLQVYDTGQGIAQSLQEPGTTVPEHDTVLSATMAGVTSTGDGDRGLGLSQVMELAKAPGRTLTITSKEAFLMLHEKNKLELGLAPAYTGTMVAATFSA